MVSNFFVQCNECKKVFRLRWQIGFKQAVVKTICPTCKNKFEIVFNSEIGNTCKNVSLLNYDKMYGDYLIEVSTEFLTKKLTLDNKETRDFLSPFMRNIDIDQKLIANKLNYVKELDKNKSEIESLFSMLNSHSEYLKQKLQKSWFFNEISKKIGFNDVKSDLDVWIITHQYLNSLISGTYLPNTMNVMAMDISLEIVNEYKIHSSEFNKYLNLLEKNDVFYKVNEKFYLIVIDMLNNYLNLIPAYLRHDLSSVDLENYGIITIFIDDILNIYKKCYEFIGEFSLIPIGLNNICERNDCDKFKNKTEDLYTLLNSINSKYNRLNDYLIDGEKFSYLFKNTLNNLIRNSEAHFDFTYNSNTQKIIFKNSQKDKEMYLIEFAVELINIYQKSVCIWEMNYCLYKIYLINIKNEQLSCSSYDN